MKIIDSVKLIIILLLVFSNYIYASHASAKDFAAFVHNVKETIHILHSVPQIPVGMVEEFTEIFVHKNQACSCVLDTHGGEQPEAICDIVLRLQRAMSGEVFNNAFLFSGPPGTGKTSLVKAIADKTDSVFIEIKASAAVKPEQGSGPAEITDKFSKVENILNSDPRKTVVIFIDEIDSIGKERVKEENYRDITNTFLTLQTYVDKYSKNSRVVIIVNSNKESYLDSALLSRFKIVEIGLPDQTKCLSIFKFYLKSLSHKISEEQLQEFVKQAYAHKFSGRHIERVVRESHFDAFKYNQSVILPGYLDKHMEEQKVVIQKEELARKEEADDKALQRKMHLLEIEKMEYDKKNRAKQEELQELQLRQLKRAPYMESANVVFHAASVAANVANMTNSK